MNEQKYQSCNNHISYINKITTSDHVYFILIKILTMNASILFVGFLFGAILQYANLNRYNVISGMATLENLTVAKAIAVAIGAGAIILAVETGLGLATYQSEASHIWRNCIGGLYFWSRNGYPGVLSRNTSVSLGEGSVDALFGIIGALAGGFIYTILLPAIQGILGPDLGTYSLFTHWWGSTTSCFIS